MTETLELRTQKHILSAIKNKALSATEGSNWLSGERLGWEKERTIKLNIEDIIVIPEALEIKINEVRLFNKELDDKIDT